MPVMTADGPGADDRVAPGAVYRREMGRVRGLPGVGVAIIGCLVAMQGALDTGTHAHTRLELRPEP